MTDWSVSFRFPVHNLQLSFGRHCTARVGDVELPGELVIRTLALIVAQAELVRDVRWPRRPLARVSIRAYKPERPRRRLRALDGRKLRGIAS